MNQTSAARESRIRRAAACEGLRVRKSRVRNARLDNRGEYMLLDAQSNFSVLGHRYDAALEDLEEFFARTA